MIKELNKDVKKEKSKRIEGITLIALVITIIVLLILAGVSIATLGGNNGIIARAKSAKDKSKTTEENENTTLNEYESYINKYIVSDSGNSSQFTSDDLKVLKEEIKNEIKSEIYPVGSIYTSFESTNPESLFGGKWEQIGQGKTLVGEGTSDGYTFTVGSTGTEIGASTNPLGEYVHQLTTDEMPSHTHYINLQSEKGIASWMRVMSGAGSTRYGNHGLGINTSSSFTDITNSGDFAGSEHTHMVKGNSNATGSGATHNNIQPYIVCYMWKKISN